MALLVIDASNIAYFIEKTLHKYGRVDDHNARLALVRYINNRLFLNSAFPLQIVWALDSKPYWRSRYEPEYKCNRRSQNQVSITPTLGLIVGECYTIAVPEFEADDIAAAIVQSTDNHNHVYLLTSDTDWSGLVSDRVTMLSPAYEPRVRLPVHVWAWLKGKHGKLPKSQQWLWDIPSLDNFHPKNIWEFKTVYGDESDGLPPNTCMGIIDLMNPLESINDRHSSSFRQQLKSVLSQQPIAYNDELAKQFVRLLPDTPFNPIRIGVDEIC